MNMQNIYDEIQFIQSHIFVRSEEEGVKRWTDRQCDDYQLPLIGITGFLSNALYPTNQEGIRN